MSDGAIKNYKFGTKNNWRRWVWNSVKSRLAVPVGHAVVLYLAGSEDLDRPVAKSKGFRDDNLIAVDRDRSVVSRLREKGVLAINASVVNALSAIPFSMKVDVVHLDFCSNFSMSTVRDVWNASKLPQLKNAVFVVNTLRGREFGQNREFVKAIQEDQIFAPEAAKNRAFMFFYAWCVLINSWCEEDCGHRSEDEKQAHFCDLFMTWGKKGAWLSYKNDNGLVFDSFVIPNLYRWWEDRDKKDEVQYAKLARSEADIKTKRAMAATLAHRTMRINSAGPYA